MYYVVLLQSDSHLCRWQYKYEYVRVILRDRPTWYVCVTLRDRLIRYVRVIHQLPRRHCIVTALVVPVRPSIVLFTIYDRLV